MSCRQRARVLGRYRLNTAIAIALLGGAGACARPTPTTGAATAAVAPGPWLWGGLRPGPHGVGIQTIATTDSTRAESAPDGTRRPRPLELIVWYPRRAGGLTTPVTFADYVELSEGSMTSRVPRTPEWRRRWLATAVSRAPDSVRVASIDR